MNIHAAFIDRKKFMSDLKRVNPLVAIFTYDSMLESGCICELVLAIVYVKNDEYIYIR